MDLIKRFLGYTAVDTQSDENSQTVPSTAKQMNLARQLKAELEGMGLEEVFMDDMGYVYASLPANTDKKIPTIGFISHMDTSPSMSGKDVKPRIVNNYDGGDYLGNAGFVIGPQKGCAVGHNQILTLMSEQFREQAG